MGAGFTSLTFTVTADGLPPLTSVTFTSLSQAENFFADDAIDLGSLATPALSAATPSPCR